MKINKIEIKGQNRKSFLDFSFCTILLFIIIFSFSFSEAATRVQGTNQVLNIAPSARQASLANISSANKADVSNILTHPAALTSLNSSWVHFTHTAYYLDDVYDYLAWAMPFDTNTSFGVSMARFASAEIPWIKEGEELPEGSDYNTLDISDYAFSFAFARRWKNFHLGGTLHFLYRSLDQAGFGFRGDLSAAYTINGFSVDLLLPGLTTSYAKWESGYSEYTKADAILGMSYRRKIPYFYGELVANWQSSPMFNPGGAYDWDQGDFIVDTLSGTYNDEYIGDGLFDSPGGWFKSSAIALEYVGDWGGSFRLGLVNISDIYSWTAGLGINFKGWMDIDYAFQNHPELSSVHRVSLNISPGLLFGLRSSKLHEDSKNTISKKSMVENKIIEKEILDTKEKESLKDVSSSEEITEEEVSTGTFLGIE